MIPVPDQEAIDRFWSRVDKTGTCWVWTGAPATKEGYGRVGIDGRKHLVHRLSYVLANGQIPDGLLVLHTCDNPPCVRPDHLFVGTDADNRADMVAKGRQVILHGEDHPRAKLSQADVDRIRSEVAGGRMQKDLAAEYGVTRQLVSAIVNRKCWIY